ncbi:MAG: WXG100 family type VII secretion target [Rhodococcus sp. (in: high G+C Gram-positive bacteria)]
MTMPFSVDPDDLEALTARISGLAGFVRDELYELDRRAASLTQGGWTGLGADAYTKAHATWANAAIDLVEHVTQIELLTRTAHHHYTATADANVRMLRGS